MPAEGNGEFPTIIGPDAKFKGDLDFEKGVRVYGQFEGTIKSKGQLHVAEGAKVKADVTAGNIDVDGEVTGNLTANGKVHLKASSKLEGDLKTARLEVAEGATFVGNCIVGAGESKEAAKPSPKASTPEPEDKGKSSASSSSPEQAQPQAAGSKK